MGVNDSIGQELSLRPNLHQGATFMKNNGRPLDDNVTCSSPERYSSHSSPKNLSRNPSKTDIEKGDIKGPERFFYDKNTYTGVAAKRASSLPSLSRSSKLHEFDKYLCAHRA